MAELGDWRASGIVLAAGRSTRMGREKALLAVDGVPQWRRQRDVLAAAGVAEIFLSARPDQTWAYGASGFSAVLNDAMPDCGPMVGITAGLERASHPHLAVLAIDLPALPPTWFARLRQRSAAKSGAVGRRGKFFEPLAAIYPVELKWLAWEFLAGGNYSLQALLTRAVDETLVSVVDIGPDEEPWFANWNREPRGAE